MRPMRTDLLGLFETDELKKYLTAEELPAGTAAAGAVGPDAAKADGKADHKADEKAGDGEEGDG